MLFLTFATLLPGGFLVSFELAHSLACFPLQALVFLGIGFVIRLELAELVFKNPDALSRSCRGGRGAVFHGFYFIAKRLPGILLKPLPVVFIDAKQLRVMLNLKRLDLRVQGNDLLGVLRGVALQLLELGLEAVFIRAVFLLGQAFLQRQLRFRAQRVVLKKRMHLLFVLPDDRIRYLLRSIDPRVFQRDIFLQGRLPLAAFPFLLSGVQLLSVLALVVLAFLVLVFGYIQLLLEVPEPLNFALGLLKPKGKIPSCSVSAFLPGVFR